MNNNGALPHFKLCLFTRKVQGNRYDGCFLSFPNVTVKSDFPKRMS